MFLAVCYESGKPPQYEGSLKIKIEKGGRGFRKSLPPLPGQDRWEGALSSQVKAITSLFIYVRTLLFQGGAALPPANPAISEPVFLTLFNSMEDFSILAIPSPLIRLKRLKNKARFLVFLKYPIQ